MSLAAAALTFALIDAVSVQVAGGTSITNWHGQADVYSVTIEATRGERTSLGVWTSPQAIWQPRSWYGGQFGDGNEKIYGISVGGVVRHRLTPRFFVEFAAGRMWTEKEVPATTARRNFVAGPGARFIFRQGRQPIFIAYQFSHISNGGQESRNPGWNFHLLGVGVTVRRAGR